MRGYDVKLALDAHVIVHQTQKGFKLSEIRQMLGRGSRSFGQCVGSFHTSEYGR